jgi:hypothetical protein
VNPSTGEATASDLHEHTSEFGAAATNPSSFGEDAGGELYIVSYAGRVYRINTTDIAPSSPRKRPADAPIVGFASPRSPTPPASGAPATTSASTRAAPPSAPTAAPAIGARRTPRTALVMKDGELWIVAMDDDTWVGMKLRDFLELMSVQFRYRR